MPTLTDRDVLRQVPQLARSVADADGVAPLSEQTLLTARAAADDPSAVVDLRWREADGQVAAVALSDGSGPTYEVLVHPDHRGRGHGRALVEGCVRRDPEHARIWAHGDLPAARAVADRLDLTIVRELWRMGRAVDAEPPIGRPKLPSGFTARAFQPGRDEQTWLDLNARAFLHHPEQGRMTMSDLRERMAQPWFDPRGLLLIEGEQTEHGEEPVVVASHWTKVEPGADEGEVYVVAVDPGYQGMGLGRAVTALGLDHLARVGVRTIDLYVEADNEPAVATYRRWGFERVAGDVMYSSPAPGVEQ